MRHALRRRRRDADRKCHLGNTAQRMHGRVSRGHIDQDSWTNDQSEKRNYFFIQWILEILIFCNVMKNVAPAKFTPSALSIKFSVDFSCVIAQTNQNTRQEKKIVLTF